MVVHLISNNVRPPSTLSFDEKKIFLLPSSTPVTRSVSQRGLVLQYPKFESQPQIKSLVATPNSLVGTPSLLQRGVSSERLVNESARRNTVTLGTTTSANTVVGGADSTPVGGRAVGEGGATVPLSSIIPSLGPQRSFQPPWKNRQSAGERAAENSEQVGEKNECGRDTPPAQRPVPQEQQQVVA